MIKMKSCPEGKEINPKTNRCVIVCKKGQVRDPETGRCKASGKCPEGKVINPKTGRCIYKKPDNKEVKECP